MIKSYSLETVKVIWNDDTGDRIEIGPDKDGLDLIELREFASSDSKCIARNITLTKDQAELLIKALQELLA